MTPPIIAPGDVVRARRYGNRHRANYVVARVARAHPAMGDDVLAVIGHREYGSGRDVFMVLDAHGARVIRSYA